MRLCVCRFRALEINLIPMPSIKTELVVYLNHDIINFRQPLRNQKDAIIVAKSAPFLINKLETVQPSKSLVCDSNRSKLAYPLYNLEEEEEEEEARRRITR